MAEREREKERELARGGEARWPHDASSEGDGVRDALRKTKMYRDLFKN